MSLTETDLAEIRRRTLLVQLALAAEFDVTPETIEAIVKGRPWKALAEEKAPGLLLFDRDDLT